MKLKLILFVCGASMMASVNSCKFGNDAIQAVYDRFELFRNTKAFDPKDPKVPLEQYQYYETDGIKRLAIKIKGNYMVEYYKTNDKNEIETKNGQYDVKDSVTLNYQRDESGHFSFDDWSNGKKFQSTLRNIDGELPDNFDEDYKKVLVDLNAMRSKMFDYKKDLNNDFEHVTLYDLHPFTSGGFYAQYADGDGNISVSKDKNDGKETISGRVSCENKDQKYNVIDGKAVADGEPFSPIYN